MADFAPTLRTLVYAAAKTNEHGRGSLGQGSP